jgi:hypothetical protein
MDEQEEKKKPAEAPYLTGKQKLFFVLMMLIGLAFMLIIIFHFDWSQ